MDLELDYEDIPGETKRDKARELVDFIEKRSRLKELKKVLKDKFGFKKPTDRPTRTFIPHPYPEAPNFTGRVAEKQMLTNWVTADSEHPLLSLVAIGGMGKSALAWRWLQEEVIGKDHQLDGIIWWSFYEKGMIFDYFIRDFVANRWGDDSPKLKKTMYELYNAVYQEFQQNRYLIVLDGIERILKAYHGLGSPYQKDDDKTLASKKDYRVCIDPNAERFLEKLANTITKSKTLLTTRLHPKALDNQAGGQRIDLKRMDPDDAVDFFHSQGIKGTRAEIQAACEPYGHHPLKLRLLSGLIVEDKENPGDCSQNKYCEIGDLAPKEHYIMEISYNALDKNKQDFISSLAAFRASMDYTAIKGICKFKTKQELDNALTELVNRGLLFWDKEKNKYDLHPIVRSYCYDRLRDKEGVHSQLRDYFASVPEPEKIESLDDLAPVIELYYHTVRTGMYNKAYSLYQNRLSDTIYFQFGAYQKEIELLSALFLKNNEIPNLKEESQQAVVMNALATSYSLSGQPRRAVPLFQLGNDLDIDAIKKEYLNFNWEDPATYPRGEEAQRVSVRLKELTIGLGNLAHMAQIPIGDLKSAEVNLQRGITLDKEVADIFQEGCDHQELGRTLSFIANFSESKKELNNAMNCFIKNENVQSQGVIWSYRSHRALFMNDPKEALRCAKQALEFAKQWEKEKYRVERDFIRVHYLLGASHVALKDLAKAEEFLQLAITECRKINLLELEADILLEIAKLRHLQEKDDESLKLASEALEIATRCPYVLQQADIEEFLGSYWLEKGDKEKANKFLEDCIEHCTHCWHYNADLKGDDKFEYIKKDEQWFYKPPYDKAVKLLSSLN